MRTEIHTDVQAALLIFDLTVELDRRLYVAYLEQLRPRLHPNDVPQVDKALEAVKGSVEPTFPGYSVFKQ